MSARRADPRGIVAVVYASCHGPMVTFINGSRYGDKTRAERVISTLRVVAAVFAKHDDDRDGGGWPRAVHLQAKPGQWERA